MTGRPVRLEPQRRIAAAEERIEEPRVASGAPLVGGDSIPLRTGRRGDLIDVDRHADPGVADHGADRLGRGGMAAELVVGDADRRRPVTQPRRVHAVGVAQECEHGRLVERHPVLDTVAQARRDQRRVVAEPAHDLGVGEAAAVLQCLRQVPVEQVDERLDAGVQQGVDEAPVEVEAELVDAADSHRQHPRPAHAEAIRPRPQIGDQPDVLLVAVVVVAGHIARAAIRDRARTPGEGIPDRRSAAVLGCRSLDLVGGGGEAPAEVSRKGPGEPGWVGVDGGQVSHPSMVFRRRPGVRADPVAAATSPISGRPRHARRTGPGPDPRPPARPGSRPDPGRRRSGRRRRPRCPRTA